MKHSGLGVQTVRGCIALAIALGSQLSHAATFAVNSTADAVDANPGDGICETAAGNGTCTLRAALQEAKRSVAPRTINLPSGEYRLSIPPDATAVPGATGALDVGLVSLVGAGADTTIIDGGALDAVMSVVQWQTADTGATSISHVTIRNGRNPPPNVGGGIVNVADLTLDSVVVRDNFAAHGGGGIANTIFGNLTIRRSTISGNTSTVFSGAGISNRGKLKVSDSTISGNQVMEGSVNASGAGLDNDLGTFELTNVTLSGNRGGGIYSASTGNNYLANVTLFGNDASFQFGSGLSIARVLDLNGVDISGRHFIKNSIIAGNSAFNCVGALVSEGHNLDSDGSCGFGSDGTSIIVSNPLLGPLQPNGGPTRTHALLPTSPAIDRGNPTGCSNQHGAVLTDQRGGSREVNGGSGSARCDIGAFEARSPVAVAGLDKRVQGGATVTLDGSASTFNPGRVASYSWTQVGGTAITLVDATTSSPTFVAPQTAGTLSFELAVTDDLAAPATSTSRVSITINAAPLSNAGMNSTVNTSMEVTLNGTASSDPDGSIVSYAWVQTGGRGVTLTGANTASARFTAPASADTLTFRLTVTDTDGVTSANSVTITVVAPTPPPPPAGSGSGGGGGGSCDPLLLAVLILMIQWVAARRRYRELYFVDGRG